MLKHYDVVIVGAGPAGAIAAYNLAKGNARVIIVEKEKLPRYKTCGGGLTNKALSHIPFSINEIIEKECFTSRVVDHDNNTSYKIKREIPLITMVMRDKFDEMLVNRAVEAGSELADGTAANRITFNENKITVETTNGTFTGKFLIAADGSNSSVRRFVQPNSLKKIPAVEYEVYCCTDEYKDTARFDFGFTSGGYAWVFPKKNHLSIGMLSSTENSRLKEKLMKYLQLLNIDSHVKIDKHGFTCSFTTKNTMLTSNRILFVGDAAGLTDPVTAEGISNAIISGKLAAEAILQNEFRPNLIEAAYSKSLSEVLNEIKYAHRLAKAIYEFPRFRKLLFHLNGQKLCEIMTDLIMGKRTYKKLLTSLPNYLKILRRYY